MNAIEASERLRLLSNATMPLETAIDKARSDGNHLGKYALEVILGEVNAEKDELQRKLSEVII